MDKQLLGFVPRFPFGLLRGSLQAGKATQQLPQLSLGCSQLGRSVLLLVSVREGPPWDCSASWKCSVTHRGLALGAGTGTNPLPWCQIWAYWGSAQLGGPG